MVYKKILVALDQTSAGKAVFEQALDLAKKDNAKLMVFHSLPLEHENLGSYTDLYGQNLTHYSQAMHQHLEKESASTREWLSEFCDRANNEGVATEWDWRIGDAGRSIRELASSWGADLIVVGRRGRQGLSEMFLGSVSNHVIHNAACSVLVVQGIGD
ncbi:MAG: universal stress protein [Oscillatoria sp. PMC 1068.18]|nr:universal stress protein [Oscillatoria sp. PMC 1076.18]MEC4987817.1 universal stress protein [Oscillatoria sp. PMC 1068.18]